MKSSLDREKISKWSWHFIMKLIKESPKHEFGFNFKLKYVMFFTERNTQMNDFDITKLHMGYFIFDFILLWNWEMFFHLCPTFKQWCRCSDTKIIQTIIYDVQMLLLSHTREGHFSVEVLRNWVFSGEEKKKNSIFASSCLFWKCWQCWQPK